MGNVYKKIWKSADDLFPMKGGEPLLCGNVKIIN